MVDIIIASYLNVQCFLFDTKNTKPSNCKDNSKRKILLKGHHKKGKETTKIWYSHFPL